MYRGYELTTKKQNPFTQYIEDGIKENEENKQHIKNTIDSISNDAGELVASKITAEWFPPIEADVFISHSHKDSEAAIGLAGFLNYEFQLESFIDSSVWGYSGDLLKLIDKEYCYQEDYGTYNYEKRNRSTSHVYMMLSVAISKMLNQCQCIIFLNTPNSILPDNFISGKTTDSPWIYSEIAMTSLIQTRTPAEHKKVLSKAMTMDEATKPLGVRYNVNTDHLASIDLGSLRRWRAICDSKGLSGQDALDMFYYLTS